MPDMLAISNDAADAAGIPRLLLLACGIAEGNLDPTARRPPTSSDDERYWPDVSGSTYQQAVRWDPDYHGGPAYPGPEEVERVLSLQADPERAAMIAAANLRGKYFTDESDAMFKALCRYNWPGGHGEPANDNVAANYRRGLAEAQAILGATPVPTTPIFNPDTPLILQNDDWSCWATSARMAVESWGRHPTEAWFEAQAIADGIESKAVGLEDGSGAAGAAWITSQYSDPSDGTPTLNAKNAASISFDEVKSVAGTMAVMLGGHGWGTEGHWTFVRRYNPATDVLELGNPAGTYAGIGQAMSRQQFGQVAPCSMIVVMADAAAPVEPPPPDPVPTLPTRADLDEVIASLAVIRSRLPA